MQETIYINDFDLTSFVFLIIIGFTWLLPLLIIIASRKTKGREKLAWILAVIFISWFAWIFYLLLAPINKTENPDK
ncbi:hypothetical protein QVZ41_14390 [Wenyingzhuangia sp. chi5]|uniref:Cardiolipin synthase N-terminal domain-containing protein n=1 Tax=Wenyingzhuangia gilva TaxID=3057677 RepID=A0ABT8VVN7_9FLAO|nr:hypothetical protein [Wenyingzhuangia sp. chi5]MDO3696038.1 hypothetical protein [Wenyingzhuangia sp. chi5]